MWKRPGGRAMPFAAVELFDVERVAFSWQARFPLAGPLAMHVADGYAQGHGELRARVLGVPVVSQTGPGTALGEALRYLAELPWVPYAMEANPELEWQETAARAVEVSTLVRSGRMAVTLEVDSGGDIVRASCRSRPRAVGKRSVPTPWVGEFGDYATLEGTRVPTAAEVWWELVDGPFVYWSGRVTGLELLRP